MLKSDRTTGFYDPALETLPPKEREVYVAQKLREIIDYAYSHAPAIKAKFEEAHLDPQQIQTVKDLEKVPITKKDRLPQLQKGNLPFGGFTTVAPHQLKRIYVSPGPIYDPQGPEEKYWRCEKVLYAAGFRRGDIVQNTFAYHLTPAGLILDEALGALGCTVIPTGVGNTELQVRILYDLKVTGYTGTPSFLMTLLRKAEELGYQPRKDLNLEVALVAAEMLPESLRTELEEDYHLLVRQGYLTADVGTIGYECREKSGMHIPEELIVEIVDLETGNQLGPGEIGEVVITNFNKAYPLIRFGTGDLSYFTDEPCPCGRTSNRLVKLVGRTSETTKVRGMFIRPGQVDEILAKHPDIAKGQMVITRTHHQDELKFRVELKPGLVESDTLKSQLEQTVREVMKLRATIEFVPGGTLPQEGKKILDERKWD
jgi:phenylacetate-CoA ligase